ATAGAVSVQASRPFQPHGCLQRNPVSERILGLPLSTRRLSRSPAPRGQSSITSWGRGFVEAHPGHQTVDRECGRAALPRRSHGDRPESGAPRPANTTVSDQPIGKSALTGLFHALVRIAEIEPIPGPGWYGIRHKATDVYEDY